jgi:membrane-associated phospholipid phosphatase
MGLQAEATDLGDLFTAAAVAAGVFVWCWTQLSRQLALAFLVCFTGAVIAAIGLKLAAVGLAAPPVEGAAWWVLSQGAPSGHACGATVVYGCAATLFAAAWRSRPALLGLAYCLTVIILVCVTRLTLHTHTLADVAAGVALGAAFAALFAAVARARLRPPVTASPTGLLAAMIVTALLALASGVRISSTQFL